jgi:hypothetical protein
MALELSSVQFYDLIVIFEKTLKKEAPQMVMSRNGVITESRKVVQARNRRSIF